MVNVFELCNFISNILCVLQMDDIKRSSKCDNEKYLSEFNFRKDRLKYRNQCRDCIKLITKGYRNMKKRNFNTKERTL